MTSPLPTTPALAAQPAPHWHLRLLGDVVLTDALGREHRLPGRTTTALLARLALVPDRAHAREALVELLWPGVALDVGRNRLRQALSTLKRLLDADDHSGVLQAERMTLRLRPGALVCDAWRFEQALRAGALSEAAALYRGELLPGFYDDWVHDERQRLQALADGLPAGLPPPLPSPAPAAPAPAAAPAALNLPHYLTRVYGTEHSAQLLLQAVTAHRLVTLLGPGGHGKTRLAVELAHALAGVVPAAAPAPLPFDLVAFVPLVTVHDTDALLMALLLALRQDGRGADPLGPVDRLASLLDGRRSLLVLDNAEQLVDSCAGLIATLLARCPGLHLLVTSRRVLGLDGEHLHLLAPLPLPADLPPLADETAALQALAANPAVALFVDRARAARAGFQLGSGQAGAVRALVDHLQGMPLAIELAAAQVRSMDPATLLGLLQAEAQQSGPGAPGLALLARSGPRAGTDPRHASMLAVVQWSWGLLSPQARALLPRLSVLAGGFSLGAAQALADAPNAHPAAVAQVLDELVSHSMLRSTDDGRRYALFELIREFAASRLDPAQASSLRQRHRQWLTGWFATLPLSAPLPQVRAEVPNLAAAFCGADLDRADADAAALAAAAQTALSTISLPPQALAALQRCVERLHDPVARAVARAGLARSLLVNGQADAAGRLADAALAELPPVAASAETGMGLARAQVLARVAHVRWRLHRDPAAAAWLDEALALARSAGALALQATILTNQGAVLRPRQPHAAIALQRQAIALWDQAGDRHGVNVGRCNLAMALMAQRAGCTEALALLQQAADDTRAADDDLQHALACNLQGEAWSRLGRWADAAAAYRACIATAWAAAEPWPLAYGLWNLPRALAHLRQPQHAARLMGFAQGHVPTVTGPLAPADRHDLRRLQRLCCCQAPAAEVARWWTDGQALRVPLAVGEALQR